MSNRIASTWSRTRSTLRRTCVAFARAIGSAAAIRSRGIAITRIAVRSCSTDHPAGKRRTTPSCATSARSVSAGAWAAEPRGCGVAGRGTATAAPTAQRIEKVRRRDAANPLHLREGMRSAPVTTAREVEHAAVSRAEGVAATNGGCGPRRNGPERESRSQPGQLAARQRRDGYMRDRFRDRVEILSVDSRKRQGSRRRSPGGRSRLFAGLLAAADQRQNG